MDATLTEAEVDQTEFDEAWYLEQNPTIAAEVRKGGFKSGWQHYVLHGRAEGRLPRADVQRSQSTGDERTPPYAAHNGPGYLTPTDLTVTDTRPRRVALIGSCLMSEWGFQIRNPSDCPVDLIVVNNSARLPELTPEVLESYDFAVIQIPLRPVLFDHTVWHFAHTDDDAYQAAFDRACAAVETMLNTWMQWNRERGMLTFVANFFVPQQNFMGRLFPKFDLRNPEYFISRLNEHLENAVRRSKNAYILDLDRISASIGRRYVQDDVMTVVSHNGPMGFLPPVTTRIEPMAPLQDHYDVQASRLMPRLIWAELLAMYRTVRQIDPVKVVIVDLDDTLWKGVSGDIEDINGFMVEGWPIGLAEALIYLKKRGILLAIASKNEESRIREIWPRIFGDRLRLEDFAAIRINWRPKTENVHEILQGMNLLARNAVFIDDNPAERDAMRNAFPDIRVLGRYPYYLRRVLLWSAETQVASVTDESSRRTEMVRAQLTRESQRKAMSRDQFLLDAAPTVSIIRIDGTGHARFARVLELVNKTNQFNTTGRRWRTEEFADHFRAGGQIIAFEVTDRFTSYGLVGVVIFREGRIEQWVMSCRVLGYQIEEAVMAAIIEPMRAAGTTTVYGRLIHTDVNFPCRELFSRCGFVDMNGDGDWALATETGVAIPAHVMIT